ncbi:hypothetical protein KUCAC02_008404 [Chaenocephalus aceratus]|uniref:Uncharacterized protein n=1 Tax=Chaenocephalus aceratus TaxID=36190 RepID=A0ACB9X8A3_CHAAC|nr:hypothetical protein KUCAC02_008404 [Chaenocephalus aceratus]
MVYCEFNRVVGKNLKDNFFDALDRFSPSLMDLFWKKKGVTGQFLSELLSQTKVKRGAFLLPYCFFALLCGVPLYLMETAMGTGYSYMVIQLYARVYTIILAWALLYLIYCFRDPLPWATCNNPWNTGGVFHGCVPLCDAGHLAGQGVDVAGAWQGVVYYLYPDPSRLVDLQVWMEACAQVLFSYGIAEGTHITMSSYQQSHQQLLQGQCVVMCAQ